MKEYILKSLTVTVILYIAVSFVRWNVLWIKDIPTYSSSERFDIMFLCFIKEVVFLCLYTFFKGIANSNK